MAETSNQLGVQRLVSGGQTGVDRGALDAAIALGIEHGGWCPRGRMAEDGRIPRRYTLTETEAREYSVRTERNVADSDGTLILHRGRLSGGTELTYRMARKHRKPCLRISLTEAPSIEAARVWIVENQVRVLNVAGPRESSSPGIAEQTREFVELVFRHGLG